MRKKFIEEEMPDFLKKFETILTNNKGGNGYFVGDSVRITYKYNSKESGFKDISLKR